MGLDWARYCAFTANNAYSANPLTTHQKNFAYRPLIRCLDIGPNKASM